MKKDTWKVAVGLAVIAGLLLVSWFFFMGLPRVSEVVYRFANPVAGIIFVLDLVLLPFALSRRLRPLVGIAIHASSFLFGIVLWTFSAIISFSLWGYFGLFFGLVWMGIGVVPVALIAAALHGYWFLVLVILGQAILVFGSRFLGLLFIVQETSKSESEPTLAIEPR